VRTLNQCESTFDACELDIGLDVANLVTSLPCGSLEFNVKMCQIAHKILFLCFYIL